MLSLRGEKQTISKEFEILVLWSTGVFHVSRKFKKVKVILREEPGKAALMPVSFLAVFATERGRSNL